MEACFCVCAAAWTFVQVLEAAAPLMPGQGSTGGSSGSRPHPAAAAAGSAAAAAVSSLISHTEKNLVDVLLLTIARAPAAALAAAEVVAAVGPGVADYLLKRVEWLLQVSGAAAAALVLL
jgi:hypothetical protein